MSTINILMIGGRRCGKTSALASIFDQIKNNKDLASYISAVSGQDSNTLILKKNELVNFLNRRSNNTFMVDSNPTLEVCDYDLVVSENNSSFKYTFHFKDVPGECFRPDYKDKQKFVEINDYAQQCHIFIIAIDTPFLMGDKEDGLRHTAVGNDVNCVDMINNFLHGEGILKKRSMLIFVPLKCEYWAKSYGRTLEEVSGKICEEYDTLITYCKNNYNMEVSIIPIQTAGNILFSEFQDAYDIIHNDIPKSDIKNYKQKCCKKVDGRIRLGERFERSIDEVYDNGEFYDKTKDDVINRSEAAILDSMKSLTKDNISPFSWYIINKSDYTYKPYNCEQIPLHILRFMLARYSTMGLLERFLSFFRPSSNIVNIMSEIQKKGFIKNEGEGIKILQTMM